MLKTFTLYFNPSGVNSKSLMSYTRPTATSITWSLPPCRPQLLSFFSFKSIPQPDWTTTSSLSPCSLCLSSLYLCHSLAIFLFLIPSLSVFDLCLTAHSECSSPHYCSPGYTRSLLKCHRGGALLCAPRDPVSIYPITVFLTLYGNSLFLRMCAPH